MTSHPHDRTGLTRRQALALGSASLVATQGGALLWPLAASAAPDFTALRARWCEMLTGGPALNTSISEVSAAILQIDANAQQHRSTMDTSSGRTYLWSDLDFTGTAHEQSIDMRITYERLQQMALAYSTKDSAYEGDAGMLADVVDGLDWMYQYKYNESASGAGNWFNWEIGVPLALNASTMMLYGQLSSGQIANYMNAVHEWTPSAGMTGANRVWKCMVVAATGAITENGTKLYNASNGLGSVFDYTTSGDGFYTDGSFIQHARHPYTGGYGMSLITNVARLLWLLDGSDWEVTDPDVGNVYAWVADAYEPWLFRGSMMGAVRGRNVARKTQQDHRVGHDIVRAIMWISEFAPAAEADAFRALVKHTIQTDSFRDFFGYEYGSTVPGNDVATIARAKALANDGSVTPAGPQVRTTQFPQMDRTVHQQPGFAFAVAMSSARIFTYESINGENLHAWYTGDGMTYLYNGHLDQYDRGFWPTVDPYRLPGTTVPVRSRADGSGSNHLSAYHWVGGTALGTAGVTGMRFQTFGSGGGQPMGKKSWFMFGDQIAALGAGINAGTGESVETIVENRKLPALNQSFFVDDVYQSTGNGWQATFTWAESAFLSSPVAGEGIGYYFPGTATVNALRETRTHSWSEINTNPTFYFDGQFNRHYLTMWIDHGVDPVDATYAYVLLPNRTRAEVRDYAANPSLEVLANTSQVQAARRGDVLGANVWGAGPVTVADVTCDGPSSLLVVEDGNQLDVAICDPTQQHDQTIQLTIDRPASGVVSGDPRITVQSLSPQIVLDVDVAGANGRTSTITLTLAGT